MANQWDRSRVMKKIKRLKCQMMWLLRCHLCFSWGSFGPSTCIRHCNSKRRLQWLKSFSCSLLGWCRKQIWATTCTWSSSPQTSSPNSPRWSNKGQSLKTAKCTMKMSYCLESSTCLRQLCVRGRTYGRLSLRKSQCCTTCYIKDSSTKRLTDNWSLKTSTCHRNASPRIVDTPACPWLRS